MGKKNRRSNKNSSCTKRELPARKGKAVAMPASTLRDTVTKLFLSKNLDELSKLESQYQHLDSFSDDPYADAWIVHAFGTTVFNKHMQRNDSNDLDRSILYLERSKEIVKTLSADNQDSFLQCLCYGEMSLSLCYSFDGRDMEKAISSYRWILENCTRDYMQAEYHGLPNLMRNFNKFKRYDYAVEVSKELRHMLSRFTAPPEQFGVGFEIVEAYIGYGELLQAKSVLEGISPANKIVTIPYYGDLRGRAEFGLCNYGGAIHHFKVAICKSDNEVSDKFERALALKLGQALLMKSKDNEVEAFEIFQKELDRTVYPSDEREEMHFMMGIEYRKLKKWDKSIEYLQCLTSQADEAIAKTYLERYCTDVTLGITKRTLLLQFATMHAQRVDAVTTDMHLIRAQLFYFNGDKHQAYRHLELYLDARLLDCKLKCYTCDQRIRTGSVPFSCACCRVASYCGRRHQKLTWKNERMSHKVLCPVLGHWRKTKKGRKNGRANEDERKNDRVFDTYFGSIAFL